jgi:restriction endonuclease S subunit
MQDITKKYITLIDFTHVLNWSVQGLLDSRFNYSNKYQLAPIGEFLSRSREIVKIQDDLTYKRITVRINNHGVILRDIEKGEKIGTKKQFLVQAGQFIFSRIDARNGAFGIIPEELDGAIVTNDFPLFDVNSSLILPQFLLLVTTTKQFIRFAQSCSSGTTNRQRMDVDLFLAQKIPLPTVPEQQKIVEDFERKNNQATEFEKESIEYSSGLEHGLFEILGVEIKKYFGTNKLIQYANFSSTSRWDTLFLLGKLPNLVAHYPMVCIRDIISNFNKDSNNKSLRVDSSKYPDRAYYYIGMEQIEKKTGNLIKMIKVFGNEIKSQTIRIPHNFFIYGKLRPYLNKYWINKTNLDNIICSSEFFVFDIDSKINKQFFKYILSSQIIQIQIYDKTSGARMPRINEEIFLDLQFPLPPKEVQDEIETKLDKLKEHVDIMKSKALEVRLQSELEFEKVIFNEP